ncbi:regulatory protein RecX [Capnocytophaga sp. ARDL2]|uniref:regulatory protein RecX n=1 Tax=Capnocytophaga sp. ARDL2 TaxID=3238809 RepID=UPI003559219E
MEIKGLSVEEAKRKAEHYCVYQDRCYKEVEQKLRSLGMFQEAIEHILLHLSQHKFIDETRFAQSFCRGKHHHQKWGKIRIEHELKLREISAYNIKLGMKEIEKEYISNFYLYAEKKWNELQEHNTDKKKQKFCNYFIRKGYETSLIFEALKDLEKTND